MVEMWVEQGTVQSYQTVLILTFDLSSVNLTFEVQAWVLCATRRLIMVNICAKFLSNPTMHG